MTTYRLPDELGGREVEVLRGFARPDDRVDVRVPGVVGVVTLDSASVLVVVPSPLPEEPPSLSVVLSIEADGTRWVFERDEDGDEGRTFTHSGTWCTTASPSEYEWGEVVGKDANGTPVLLVPSPEPVTLPWDGKTTPISSIQQPSMNVAVADTKDGVWVAARPFGDGQWLLSPDVARGMAYALLAAADEADRRVAAEPQPCGAAWETSEGCYSGNRIHDCALIGGHRTHRCSCGASTEDGAL